MERKRSSGKNLKATKLLLSQTIDFLPDPTFATDLKGKVIVWNRAMEELTQVRAEDMIGKADYEYALPFYDERRPILIDLVLHPDPDFDTKYTSIQKKGDSLFAETVGLPTKRSLWGKASPIHDNNGQIIGAIESIRDITELRRTEEALLKSEMKYRDVFLNVSDLLILHDLEGNFIETNLASKKSTGYSDVDLKDMNLKDILSERYKAQFTDYINRVLTNGSDEGFMTITTRTGEERILEYRNSLILDPEGKPAGVRGSARDITSRIKAAKRFKKERDFITSIIQTSPAFYDAIDPDGRTIFMNQSMLSALGYSLSDVVDKDYVEQFIQAEDRMAFKDAMDTMVSSKRPVVHENRILAKDGKTLLVQWQGKAMFRDNGELEFVFGIGIDISQQRNAQELILSSEKKFETVFQSSPVPSAITDIETGMIINANRALESLAGFTLEEAADRTSLDIGIWNNPEDIDRIIRKIVSENPVDNEEVEYRLRGGEIRNILYSGRLIDIDGKPHILSHAQDITEHKQAEQALKESEKRYRILAENARDVIWILDLDLKYLYMSPSIKRLRGYSAEEVMKQSLDQILTPESYRRAMEVFKKELGLERMGQIHGPDWSRTIEIEMFCKDGSTVWTEVIINLLYDKEGTLTCFMGITRDITERKRMEEDLRESEEKFRLLFEKSGDGSLILDEGRYIDCNEAAIKIAGCTDKSQLINYRPAEISPPLQPDGLLSAEKADKMINLAIEKGSHQFEWVRKRFDGTEVYLDVVLTAIPMKGRRLLYTTWRDISERKRSENLMRARLRLMEFASTHSLAELLQATVDEVEALTNSRIGFYHFLEALQDTLADQAWSTNTLSGPCSLSKVKQRYPLAETGVWTDCIHNRRPVIHNDYAALSHRKGLPEGHPEIIRELVVPVIRGERIMAVLGVGNKLQDYTQGDIATATLFADLAWDIAQQKRMDEALRESEVKYRTIFENASEGIFQTTTEGRILNANPSLARMFGFSSPKEMIEGLTDIGQELYVNPNDRQKLLQMLREHNSVGGVEAEMRRKDGSTFWISIYIHSVRDAAGNIAYLEGTNADITGRKQAEEKIRESEIRFKAQYHGSPTPTFTWRKIGEDFVLDDYNNAASVVTNGGVSQFIGKTADEMYHNQKDILQDLHRCFDEKTVLKKELQSEHFMPGRLLILTYTFVPHDLIMVHLEDITENKKAEEDRKIYEARLMRSQKLEAIGTLAGGIAHDFNNILSAIIGYSELAQDDLPEDSTVQQSIREVLKAAERAKELVKQILTFSRQRETERRPVKIDLIIKEALKLLRSSIPSTISITERIDTSSGTVFADPTHIHQVIMNLCTNAYHAMLPNGGDLTLSLEQLYLDSGFILKHPPLRDGPHLCLIISDTGSGMDQETMNRIFDPFFTTKEKGKGTGLGLATVHGIVTDLGGAIFVTSTIGRGSSFEVYLPIYEEESDELENFIEAPPQGKGESILLVDDEEAILNFSKTMLEQLGYKVKSISSSIEALKIFRSAPDKLDLVITDQTMPGMTGSALATEILTIRPDMPIILMTGYSETITPEEVVAQGIKEYIEKPFTKNIIAAAIHRSLKG